MSMKKRSEAGFTLLEAIVSVAIMIVILLGLLALLEFNSRVAKAQVNVSEMQQSLRAVQSDIVRQVRMAGRGGLPAVRPRNDVVVPPYAGKLLPEGLAIEVDNDVEAGTILGDHQEAAVVPGTDVLTVRGVIAGSLYQVNAASDGTVPDTGTGTVTVRDVSLAGVPQDLQPLREAIDAGETDALLLVSALADDIQAVVELTGGVDNTNHVILSYRLKDEYKALSPNGGYPQELTTVSEVGLVEEYRYYVRDAPDGPRLSRARFDPGTNAPWRGDNANLTVDLADNILDLQVALGIDRNATDRIEDTGDAADDWMFNHPEDSTDATFWNSADPAARFPLYYLRLTTVARSDRGDLKYVSPAIQAIEDHVYDEPEEPADGPERLERSYRRRFLRTVVDLRNVS